MSMNTFTAACSFAGWKPLGSPFAGEGAPDFSGGAAVFILPELPASYWIGLACACALVVALVAVLKRMERDR